MKSIKCLTLICFGFAILISTLSLISNILMLISVINYSGFILWISAILTLVAAIIILILSIVGMVNEASKNKAQTHYVPIILSLFIGGSLVSSVPLLFVMASELIGLYIGILFLFFAAVILLVVGGLIFKRNSKVASIISIIGFALSFILVLMALSGVSITGRSIFAIVQYVLIIFYCIFGIIVFALNLWQISNSAENEPSYKTLTNNKDNKDIDSKLERLKHLLDQGILTQEEYEEKRKKYINLL